MNQGQARGWVDPQVTWALVRAQVDAQIVTPTWEKINARVWERADVQAWAQAEHQVDAPVWRQVRPRLGHLVRDQTREALR